MVKVLDIDIFMVDEIVIMYLDKIGTEEQIKMAQIEYLKNCPYQIKYKLIKLFRTMNFETSKMDDEILDEILHLIKSSSEFAYEYSLIEYK